MSKKILYLDGVTGLGEHEGDGWAYGTRFQVPPGDERGIRNHIFKNEGRFFSDALGGDYKVWFGEIAYIVPKDTSLGHYPWMQAGGWMKVGNPRTSGTFRFPFDFARFNSSGNEWWASGNYFNINASNDELRIGANVSGIFFTVVPDQWFWFEYRLYSHTSGGVAEIRINETVIRRWTGIQTVSTGGASPPSGEIGLNASEFWYNDWFSSTHDCKYDDMYVMFADTEGELDWFGKSTCEPLMVKADGAENEGAPLGPSNWDSVDFPVDDALYVSSGVGDRDCFAFSNLEDDRSRNVHGVKVTARARKSNTAGAQIRCYCRVGGTNYYGDTLYLSSEWREYIHIWDTNPAGGAWTRTIVDASQFGFERVS